MWQITTNNCVQISSTQKQTSEPRPRLKSVYRPILTKQLQLFYYSKHCIFIVNGQFRQTDPRPLRRPEYTSVSQTFSTGCRRVFQPVVSTWNWPPHMVGWSVVWLVDWLHSHAWMMSICTEYRPSGWTMDVD